MNQYKMAWQNQVMMPNAQFAFETKVRRQMSRPMGHRDPVLDLIPKNKHVKKGYSWAERKVKELYVWTNDYVLPEVKAVAYEVWMEIGQQFTDLTGLPWDKNTQAGVLTVVAFYVFTGLVWYSALMVAGPAVALFTVTTMMAIPDPLIFGLGYALADYF